MVYIPSFSEIQAVAQARGMNSHAPHLWSGLAGAWPMQEGGGAVAYDASGLGANGSFSNLPVTATGVNAIGRRLYFAGTNQVITATLRAAPTNDVTFSFWASVDSHRNYNGFFKSNEAYGAGCTIYEANDATKGMSFGVYTAVGYSETQTKLLPSTGLHHIVCRRSGASLLVYVDGKLNPEGRLYGPAPSGAMTFSAGIKFGVVVEATASTYLIGSLSNFVIWNHALTLPEIEQLYTDPWAMYTPVRKWWPVVSGGAATPWLYARKQSQIIGSGLGV